MATVYEWKFQSGWISIADNPNKNKSERDTAEYAVYVDPTNVSDWYFNTLDEKSKRGIFSGEFLTWLFNTEVTGEPLAEKIITVWRNLGSPLIDRTAPGYEAPVFPYDLDPAECR